MKKAGQTVTLVDREHHSASGGWFDDWDLIDLGAQDVPGAQAGLLGVITGVGCTVLNL